MKKVFSLLLCMMILFLSSAFSSLTAYAEGDETPTATTV